MRTVSGYNEKVEKRRGMIEPEPDADVVHAWIVFLPLELIMGKSYLGVSKLRELLLIVTGVSAPN